MTSQEPATSDNRQIAQMWTLPLVYTPDMPVGKVHAYLIDLVAQAATEKSMEELLTAPGKYKVSHIRERIKRLIFSDYSSNDPKALIDIAEAANLLEQLLQNHPQKEAGLSYTSRQPSPNLFPTSITESLRVVDEADRAFIDEIRAGIFQSTLSCEARVGLLILCAVLRLGQVSLPVIIELVLGTMGRLKMAKSWMYLNLHIQGTAKRPQQSRRIFLDPPTAAAFAQADPELVREFTQSASYSKSNSSQRRALEKAFLERCYKAFLTQMQPSNQAKFPRSFSALLTHKSDVLFLKLPGWVLLYAQGEVASTSLAESTFLRLLGCTSLECAEQIGKQRAGDDRIDDTDINPSVLVGSGLLPSIQDSGELDISGFVSNVHCFLRMSPRVALNAIDKGLADMAPSSPGKNPEHILLEYLRSMVEPIVNNHKNKRKLSTIRYMVGVFFTRFLYCFEDFCQHGVTGEGLGDLYRGILELSASPGHEVQVAKANRDFHRFFLKVYVEKYRLDIDPVDIDFSGSSGYSVSAHVLTPREMAQVTTSLTSDFSRLQFKDRKRAALLVNLSFYLGLRRSEMLGALVRDVHLDEQPIFVVRANDLRTLKTPNARRLIPMGLMPPQFWELAAEFVHQKHPSSPLFFDTAELGSDRQLTDAIRATFHEVTQSKSLHLHSLRHACATWMFLGMHADDVGLKRYRSELPFLDDVLAMGEISSELVYTRGHRQGGKGLALSALLGHGSELTSLGHYVHCMDLLHFSALDRSDDFYEGPTLRAALGLPKSSRLTPHARGQWSELLVSQFPERFDCARPVACIHQSDPTNVAGPSGLQLSVQNLINKYGWLNSIVLRGGEPLAQCGVAMRATSSVLRILNAARAIDPAGTLRALELLEAKRHKHRHTSCVSASDLRTISRGMGLQGESAAAYFQVFRIERVKRLGKGSDTHKRELTDAEVLQVLHDPGLEGTYWVMLRDGSPRNSKGLCRFSGSQSAITGVAIATLMHFHSLSKGVSPVGFPQVPDWLFKST